MNDEIKTRLLTDLKKKMTLEFGNVDIILAEFIVEKSNEITNAFEFKTYVSTVKKVKAVSGNQFLQRDETRNDEGDIVLDPPKNHFYKDFMRTQM